MRFLLERGFPARWMVVVGCLLAVVGCSGGSEVEVEVLFVGNSFTHSNDLPGVVEKIADANGVSINVEMIAPGGWFLDEHAGSEESMEAVSSGGYDVVVLFQTWGHVSGNDAVGHGSYVSMQEALIAA